MPVTDPKSSENVRFAVAKRGIAALICAAGGVTTLVAQATSANMHGHAGAVPLDSLQLLGVAGGLGLLVLAHGLWRGKRRAAAIAVVTLLTIAAVRILLVPGWRGPTIAIGLAAVLVMFRGAFPRGSAPRRRQVVFSGTIALVAAAGLYAVHTAALLALHHRPDVDKAALGAGRVLLAGAGWPQAGSLLSLTTDALVALLVIAGAIALRGLLRPGQGNQGHQPEEHARALAIVEAHGRDSLDPFALREDKALHFAAGGFLAYRVLRETAVVSGDPIGPPGAAGAILESFLGFAQRQGWEVVVTAASCRYLKQFEALGLRTLRIGEEAVVDPSGFSLEGRAIRKVRQSVTRVERRGWRVEVVEDHELTPEISAELERVEESWRSRQARLSGFAMTLGRLVGADEDQTGIYVLGRDPEGVLHSFLRFASYRDGLSLDLMRRGAEEPNGLTEAEIVAALAYAKGRGMSSVSLNFAGFAHVMAADAALSRSQRLLRVALRSMHGRFQLERLMSFNAKFGPSWQARHLVYGRFTQLPLAALRVLQAEAYIPAPAPGAAPRRLTRGRLAWAGAAVAISAALILLEGGQTQLGQAVNATQAGTHGAIVRARGSAAAQLGAPQGVSVYGVSGGVGARLDQVRKRSE